MTWRSVSARIRCVEALGWRPSSENALPNGRRTATVSPALPCGKYGNGRTCAVSWASCANFAFTSRYAQWRALAWLEMYVLYAVIAPINFTSSDGTTIAATVSAQSRLRGRLFGGEAACSNAAP